MSQGRRISGWGLVAAVAPLAAALAAQAPLADSSRRAIVHGAPVEYLYPEQVTIPAQKPAPVTLHFRVAPGFHINSHKPREEALVPTSISIPAASGVLLKDAAYPEGTDFVQPLDPGTTLSVYTGEFAIETRLIAPRGNHLVEASLHYQACDKSACYPPKSMVVAIDVIGN